MTDDRQTDHTVEKWVGTGEIIYTEAILPKT